MQKIYQIGDDPIAITTAGLVGDARMLVRVLSAEARIYRRAKREPITVKAIATLLSGILNARKFFPCEVQILIGGIDKNGPRIFSIDAAGGDVEEKELTATGSGCPAAYGVLDDRYSKGIPMEEAKKLAVKAIIAAKKRDSATGGAIELIVITKEKGYERIGDEEIKSFVEDL
jgi:proteasome beta subunit